MAPLELRINAKLYTRLTYALPSAYISCLISFATLFISAIFISLLIFNMSNVFHIESLHFLFSSLDSICSFFKSQIKWHLLRDAFCDCLYQVNLFIFFLASPQFVITLFIYAYLFILYLLNTRMKAPCPLSMSNVYRFCNFISCT